MPENTLINIQPRKYQQEIYETCKTKNCLVVLPTGIGKTLIALMLTVFQQKKYPGTKILFLAPTRPLAQQHLEYFKKHLPELFAQMELFTGKIEANKRRELWQRADIIFSTPQCVANDLKNNLYDLNDVSLLIEDECHRCLKNYSYTYVAKIYKEQSKNQKILGMTASPGVETKTIEQIAKNLDIEAIELRTRESEDVKEYIQDLDIEKILVLFPAEFEEIRVMLKEIYDKKVEELKNRKLLFGNASKKTLLECQHNIMRAIASGNRNFNLLAGASSCAIAVKLQHALELLETQTLSSFKDYLQEIYTQAEQGKSKAVKHLIKMPLFNSAYVKTLELITRKVEHPKIQKLKEIIEQKIKENSKAKIIVFSQYRMSVIRICKELNLIIGIRAKVFIGQAKKITKSGEEIGLSQKEQQEIIEEFKLGKINVMCCTSIGEEGLDIPEVNAVVFYEPIPSAIRAIQRRGRTARLMKGSLIMLITKNTRDESYYWAAFHKEKKMYKSIDQVKNKMENDSDNSQKKLFNVS